jgi:hypothetical protein
VTLQFAQYLFVLRFGGQVSKVKLFHWPGLADVHTRMYLDSFTSCSKTAWCHIHPLQHAPILGFVQVGGTFRHGHLASNRSFM